MKKQYISPACMVVTVSIENALMAASPTPASTVSFGDDEGSETSTVTTVTTGQWAGSKDFDWED